MKKITSIIILILFVSCSNDENTNNNSSNEILTIGTQVWQSKNLDVDTYRDGTPIPQVTDPTDWENLTTGAWCYYNNDPANNATYGKLYNWYAVAGIHDNDPNTPNKVLAPTGWHVPSDNEWATLTTFLGGGSIAGGKMKSTGTLQAGTGLWETPNSAATNESGFTGLPAGLREVGGIFIQIGYDTHWWSSSENNASNASSLYVECFNGNATWNNDGYRKGGLSVRCLRD